MAINDRQEQLAKLRDESARWWSRMETLEELIDHAMELHRLATVEWRRCDQERRTLDAEIASENFERLKVAMAAHIAPAPGKH